MRSAYQLKIIKRKSSTVQQLLTTFSLAHIAHLLKNKREEKTLKQLISEIHRNSLTKSPWNKFKAKPWEAFHSSIIKQLEHFFHVSPNCFLFYFIRDGVYHRTTHAFWNKVIESLLDCVTSICFWECSDVTSILILWSFIMSINMLFSTKIITCF